MGLDALKISQMKHNDLISLIRVKSINEYHILIANQPIESIDFYGEDWCHNKKDFFHLKSSFFKKLKRNSKNGDELFNVITSGLYYRINN